MKYLFLLSVLFTIPVYASPTKLEQEHQKFCTDMAGMSIVIAQFRDQGIDLIRVVSEWTLYLKEHPDFPATSDEKEYAKKVMEDVFKSAPLSGNELANKVFNECIATQATL